MWTPGRIFLAHSQYYSVLQRWNATPKGMKGWTEISLLGQAYEFASREGVARLTFLVEGEDETYCFLGIGHGVIECIGEEASHRLRERTVKSSVDDAAMARMGTFG